MAVTISDCLKLPSLKEANVVAGHKGLDQVVANISVLEYAKVFAMADALFQGNELIISAFTSVMDNVEDQCTAIRRLHEVGEVGLILYYVDYFLKSIDPKLVQIADELSFPIIVMPPKAYNLRYSEVTSEVLEAVFEDRKKEARFAPTLLKQISNMQERQRNVSGILRLLSDRLRYSFLLLDRTGRERGIATWPMYISDELTNQFRDIADNPSALPLSFTQNDATYEVHQRIFDVDAQSGLHLYIMGESGQVNSDSIAQSVEILQTSYGLWHKNLMKEETDDLVRIILNEKEDNVYRVANQLKLDLKSLRTMWVLRPKAMHPSPSDDEVAAQNKMLKAFLTDNRKKAIVDSFDKGVVAFMSDAKHLEIDEVLVEEFMDSFSTTFPDTLLIWSGGMDSILDAKKAYIMIEEHFSTARIIYPLKNILSLLELSFSETCYNVVHGADGARKQVLSVLSPLEGRKDESELLQTLMVYLIDSNQNAAKAASTLHIHESTVKYRLTKINRLLGCDISQMPATFYLYQALAVKRLLNKSNP